MAKLTDSDLQYLKLIKRSQKSVVEGYPGWVPVSKCLWDLVYDMNPELIDTHKFLDNEVLGGMVRLTQESETLVKWL